MATTSATTGMVLRQGFGYNRAFYFGQPGLGSTVVVNISKNAGAFSASLGSPASEIGNGWYLVFLGITDLNTPGDLAFYCTANTSSVAISSGSYTTGTGVVSLTLAAGLTLVVGATYTISGATGTGSFGLINGTFVAGSGTTGTTLNYTIAPGQTMTITGGSVVGVLGGPVSWNDQVVSQVFTQLRMDGSGYAQISSNFRQGAAINGFPFTMTSAVTGTPLSGIAAMIVAQRSLGGGGFAPCANAVTEVGFGDYAINLAITDTNAPFVMLRFTAPGANDVNIALGMQA
jgi:hypothetical protein